ncbi:hypothetical protein, partial [Litchfieldella anticariensis]|uniref:hypothetical protein n=1 Tax=Litchfieldella anticariensis TaxID=258591 RepID=UPI001B7FADC1
MNHLGRVALPKWTSLIRYFDDQTYQGARLDLSAGRDVRLTASEIDSGAGLAIAAGNDILLDAA